MIDKEMQWQAWTHEAFYATGNAMISIVRHPGQKLCYYCVNSVDLIDEREEHACCALCAKLEPLERSLLRLITHSINKYWIDAYAEMIGNENVHNRLMQLHIPGRKVVESDE